MANYQQQYSVPMSSNQPIQSENMGSQKDDKQMRSVFVGNIPYEASDDDLKAVFSKVGQVLSFRIVYDRDTGKPKGYGFCEYRDQETAQSAIRNLNGVELHNRVLRVDSAVNEKNKEEVKDTKQSEIPTFGPPVSFEDAPETITKVMASLNPLHVIELLQKTKTCIQNNPEESRVMLLQNPQLGYALLQALILLKVVDPKMAHEFILKQTPADSYESPARIPKNPRIEHDFPQEMPPESAGLVMARDPAARRPHHVMDRPAAPKAFRREQPYGQYPRQDFSPEFKRQQPKMEVYDDNYYNNDIPQDFSVHMPPQPVYVADGHKNFERDRRGNKSSRSPPRYGGYDHRDGRDISPYSINPDPRMSGAVRREKERMEAMPPREAPYYDVRDNRLMSKSHGVPPDPRDPRLQASLRNKAAADEAAFRDRDYGLSPRSLADRARYPQSRFH